MVILSREGLDELIAAFVDPRSRLLVVDDDIASVGCAYVRVAHEALLSHWPRAKNQIAKDSRDLALLGRLEKEAERWQASSFS